MFVFPVSRNFEISCRGRFDVTCFSAAFFFPLPYTRLSLALRSSADDAALHDSEIYLTFSHSLPFPRCSSRKRVQCLAEPEIGTNGTKCRKLHIEGRNRRQRKLTETMNRARAISQLLPRITVEQSTVERYAAGFSSSLEVSLSL